MSVGHCTARNRSRIECRKLCNVQPAGTWSFSHLLIAALAEFALVRDPRLYLRKAYDDLSACCSILCAAQRAIPDNGITLALADVLRLRQGPGVLAHFYEWNVSLKVKIVQRQPCSFAARVACGQNHSDDCERARDRSWLLSALFDEG